MERQYTNAQRLTIAKSQLAHIKSECHQAVNPVSIRDRVRDLISLLEFVLCGEISDAQPNVVPGTPAGQLEDPTKTRVEFFAGPGGGRAPQQELDPFGHVLPAAPPSYQAPLIPSYAPRSLSSMPVQPRPPVNSSDVHFVPSAGGGPVSGGGASAGQTVEYYNGPGMAETPPPGGPPSPDPTQGAQRVELFAGPPQQATTVSNQPPQIIRNQPTLTTEAGHPVAPTPPSPSSPALPGHPMARGGAPGGHQPTPVYMGPPPRMNGQNGQTIFPGYPPPAEPLPGSPRTLDEARSAIPIPLAE